MVAFHIFDIEPLKLFIIRSQEMIKVDTFRIGRPDGFVGSNIKEGG
jgi:hypothetical protein